mmetsp:Transcript_18842/g.43318  ORF Transcript_18842/g.43318 Transcript_18842/m.43318 type:complete len:229 (-) Transcript_18842:1193-1879(-)
MHAPFAAFIRLSAIDPDASTAKITRAPAFLTMRLMRTSEFSMYTLLSALLPPAAFASSARFLLVAWYGADALIVASTARRVTRPRGSIALMYRPRSWLKISPRPPEDPLFCFVMKLSSSASTTVSSASNMNSWGISGSGSACSSFSFSLSGWSVSSSSTSSSVSSRLWGGGGGGGICIISSSISGSIMYLDLGAMTSLTASFKSSAFTARELSAALALATSHAKSSAR